LAAAGEHFGVFLWRSVGLEDFEPGVQPIGHVTQEEAGSLLAFILDEQGEIAVPGVHGLLDVAHGSLGTHFIAAQVDVSDGFEHIDTLHLPADLWLPQDRLKDGPGGRWGDHVIGHPFNFHLRAGKAGEGA
jgi:hypothetical protein